MHILLCGLTGNSYLKAVFRSNLTEKIDLLFNEFDAAERSRVCQQYREGSVAFAYKLLLFELRQKKKIKK